MRHQTFDAVNGVGAASLIVATIAGMSIQEWAAAAALVYSVFLIAEKVYVWVQRFKDRNDR